MQKSNRIECRVTDLEKQDWQKAAGGSRRVSEWLRGLANAECERLRSQSGIERIIEEQRTPAGRIEPVPNAKPLIVADAISKGLTREGGSPRLDKCPRAHHHRPGRYCGTCKKVATKVGE